MKILLNDNQKKLLNNYIVETSDTPDELADNMYVVLAVESLGTTIRPYRRLIQMYTRIAREYADSNNDIDTEYLDNLLLDEEGMLAL